MNKDSYDMILHIAVRYESSTVAIWL